MHTIKSKLETEINISDNRLYFIILFNFEESNDFRVNIFLSLIANVRN